MTTGMKRIRLWQAMCVVLVCLTGHSAAAGETAPDYDGTGSLGRRLPGGPPYDSSRFEAYKAQKVLYRQNVTKLAEKGNLNAIADLGALLEQGDVDGDIDRAAAFDLYERAADRGHKAARQKMCVAYLLGEGRPVNVAKGMPHCNALGAKDPAGLFGGGFDFEHGISGPADPDLAAAVYLEAGKLGSGEAMDALGRRALELNLPDAARKWFRHAVFLGSVDAMDHLAAMAEAGQGGPADPQEAYWLYVNAARHGNAHAATWLAGQPVLPEPLDRVSPLAHGKTLISEVVTDKEGTRSVPFDLWHSGSSLANYYPSPGVNGSATIHCYINAAHEVDVCIRQREYPLGFGFGWLISALFDGKLVAADQDGNGRSTANTVFTVSLNWEAQ